jgi:hypothetical protein
LIVYIKITWRGALLYRYNSYQWTTEKDTKTQKISITDNKVCCQNLLLNQTVVDNHIFSATKIKLRKYKSCHEDARKNGTSTDSKIVPFAVDALGNFCSVSIILLKKLAKVKF